MRTLKIFLPETTRRRVLVFDLMDLYQVCSNYAPGAKTGPALWITCFTYKAYIGKHENIFLYLSKTTRHIAADLIGFGYNLRDTQVGEMGFMTVPRRHVASFVDPCCYLCFVFVFVILSCPFLVTL